MGPCCEGPSIPPVLLEVIPQVDSRQYANMQYEAQWGYYLLLGSYCKELDITAGREIIPPVLIEVTANHTLTYSCKELNVMGGGNFISPVLVEVASSHTLI